MNATHAVLTCFYCHQSTKAKISLFKQQLSELENQSQTKNVQPQIHALINKIGAEREKIRTIQTKVLKIFPKGFLQKFLHNTEQHYVNVFYVADHLQKQIAIAQKKSLLALGKPQNSVPIKEMLHSYRKYNTTQQAQIEAILDKYAGVHADVKEAYIHNGYHLSDFSLCDWVIKDIEKLKKNRFANPEELDNLTKLQDVLQDVKAEIKTAIEDRLELLKSPEFEALVCNPLKTEADQIEFAKQSHDLYWSFYNPFAPKMNFGQMCLLASQMNPELKAYSSDPAIGAKLAQLNAKALEINEYAVGKKSAELRSKYPETFKAHKLAFIKKQMAANSEKLKQAGLPSKKIAIIGGGPGGLIRGLTAAVMGHESTIYEKRETYTRKNLVKLLDLDVLNYFGVIDRLLDKNVVYPAQGNYLSVMIKELEMTLEETLLDISPASALKKGYEFVDLKPSKEDKPTCLFRSKAGKPEWQEADLVADVSGGIQATAKILGDYRENFATSSFMVAGIVKSHALEGEKAGKQSLPRDIHVQTVIPLYAPGIQYHLIRPKQETQNKLARTAEKISRLEQKCKQVDDKHAAELKQKLEKHRKLQQETVKHILLKSFEGKLNKKFVYENDVELAALFPVSITAGAPVQAVGKGLLLRGGDALATPDPLSGTGCVTALKGATIFSKALNSKASLTQAYEQLAYGSDKQSDSVITNSLASRDKQYSTGNGLPVLRLLPKKLAERLYNLILKKENDVPFTIKDEIEYKELKNKLISNHKQIIDNKFNECAERFFKKT